MTNSTNRVDKVFINGVELKFLEEFSINQDINSNLNKYTFTLTKADIIRIVDDTKNKKNKELKEWKKLLKVKKRNEKMEKCTTKSEYQQE
jgi:hypothetical protein